MKLIAEASKVINLASAMTPGVDNTATLSGIGSPGATDGVIIGRLRLARGRR
ncbi:hypothetical protein ACW73L_21360 [Methylolobus aquaticus]